MKSAVHLWMAQVFQRKKKALLDPTVHFSALFSATAVVLSAEA